MSYEYRNRPRYGPPIEPHDDYFTKVQKTLRMAGLIEDRYAADHFVDLNDTSAPATVVYRPGPKDRSPEAEAAWHVFRHTDYLQRRSDVRLVHKLVEEGREPQDIALALMERFASPEDATLFKMFWEGR